MERKKLVTPSRYKEEKRVGKEERRAEEKGEISDLEDLTENSSVGGYLK